MARKTTPQYCRQKHRGGPDRAFVQLDGRRIYLGEYGTSQSKHRYHRLLAEWTANGQQATVPDRQVTIVEMIARFLRYAECRYRNPDGKPTQEIANFKPVLKLLRNLYGSEPASSFTPMSLKAVREKMIESGWSRRYVNRQVVRLRSLFKWAVSEGLVPVTVHQALCCVTALQRGRSEARERPPVRPVTNHEIEKVLPNVASVIRDMIHVQLWTGMRPDEVCSMRPVDLDVCSKVWVYRPVSHKNMHRGKERTIHVGPKAQKILGPYLANRAVDHPIFSPAEAEKQRRAELHAERKTPMSCGNTPGSRRKPQPQHHPRQCYRVSSYAQAIRRACEKTGIQPHWTPNQLRHTAGTRIRQEAGLETARAVLGHTTLSVTEQFYALEDAKKAADVIAKLG